MAGWPSRLFEAWGFVEAEEINPPVTHRGSLFQQARMRRASAVSIRWMPTWKTMRPSGLRQLFNNDITPFDLPFFVSFTNAVDLEGDESRRGHVVFEVADPFSVDPCLNVITVGHDSHAIPRLVLKGSSCLCGKPSFVIDEPAAASFVVDIACITTFLLFQVSAR